MQGGSNAAVFERQPPCEVRPAHIAGLLYDTGLGYPAMRLAQAAHEGSARVLGEFMAFEDLRALLPALDAIEECFGPDDPATLYHRVVVPVRLVEGGSRLAWAYLAARPDLLAVRIPSGDWRTYRSRGASPRQAPNEM